MHSSPHKLVVNHTHSQVLHAIHVPCSPALIRNPLSCPLNLAPYSPATSNLAPCPNVAHSPFSTKSGPLLPCHLPPTLALLLAPTLHTYSSSRVLPPPCINNNNILAWRNFRKSDEATQFPSKRFLYNSLMIPTTRANYQGQLTLTSVTNCSIHTRTCESKKSIHTGAIISARITGTLVFTND